jgi:hypothetical protein
VDKSGVTPAGIIIIILIIIIIITALLSHSPEG